jgi:hypothetical protein
MNILGEQERSVPEDVWSLILLNIDNLAIKFRFSVVSKLFLQLIYNSVTSLMTKVTIRQCKPFLQRLTSLTKINLSYNQFIRNEAIENLVSLTYLDLESNYTISDVALTRLTKLRTLSLYDNQSITNNAIKELYSLTSINLDDNKYISDEGICNLTNLEELDLSSNKKITDNSLKKLVNLRRLNIGNNSKITIKGFSHLSKLSTLILKRIQTLLIIVFEISRI